MYSEQYDSINELEISKLNLQNTLSWRKRNGKGGGSTQGFPPKGTFLKGKQQELGEGSPRGISDQDNRGDETVKSCGYSS